MPFSVPVATRRVQREALPGGQIAISTVPGDFGNIQAQLASQIGGNVLKLGTKALESQERISLVEAERKTTQEYQLSKIESAFQEEKDKLYAKAAILEYQDAWQAEKDNFLSTTRLGSEGITKGAADWHDTFSGNIISKLSSSRQKELVRASLQAEKTKNINKISEYEAQQLSIAKVELNESLYANAVLEASDPLSNNVDRVHSELIALDALNEKFKDYDPETRKRGIEAGMSDFHSAVINGKIAGDITFAREYFNKIKKAILPKERAELNTLLRKEEIAQSAESIADNITTLVSDRAEWANKVDVSTKDKDIRIEAKRILDARKKDADAHDKEIKQRTYNNALEKIYTAPNLEAAQREAMSIPDIVDRDKALKVANARYKAKTEPIKTDPVIYLNVKDDITNGKYKNVKELLEFYPYLSSADFRDVVNDLERKIKEDNTGIVESGGYVRYKTALKGYQGAIDGTFDKTDEGQNREFAYVLKELDDQARILGRDLSPVEAYNFASDALLKASSLSGASIGEGFIYGDKDETFSDAIANDRQDVWLPVINSDDIDKGAERKQIKDVLRGQGFPTDDEILMRYFKRKFILKIKLSPAQEQDMEARLDITKRKPMFGDK